MKISSLILITIFSSLALADEESAKKHKNYTLEQSNPLPVSVLDLVYNNTVKEELSADSKLVIGKQLNMLMYSGIHDYENAIKAFQKDLGTTPTGKLTNWQIEELNKRSEMQKLPTIGFPDTFSSGNRYDLGIASVTGTMQTLDERFGLPVNHVSIICDKSDEFCAVRIIALKTPDEISPTFYVYQELPEHYKITHWGKDTIDAVSIDERCRSTLLSLNFETKEFYQITRNGKNNCDHLRKLSKPRIAQIVDGREIMRSEFNALKEKAYSYLSSDYRGRVDMQEKTEPKQLGK